MNIPGAPQLGAFLNAPFRAPGGLDAAAADGGTASHQIDRLFAGLIAVFGFGLPTLVIGFDLLAPPHSVRGSLSEYYYSTTGDLFVGLLCAITLFFVMYRGFHGKDAGTSMEFRISTAAGLSAMIVAFFPTGPPHATAVPLNLVQRASRYLVDTITPVEWIHYGSAGLFLTCLGAMSQKFSHEPNIGKWKTTQQVCTVLISGAILFMVLFQVPRGPRWDYSVLVGEIVSVAAFSTSWLARARTQPAPR